MEIINKHMQGCPSGSIYIGRGSPFGNLLVIGTDGTREEVIAWYRHWLRNKLTTRDPKVEKAFRELTSDSKLLCFCAPRPCHGDVIQEYWEFFSNYSDYEEALKAFTEEYKKQDTLLHIEYRTWLINKLIARDPVILNDFRNVKSTNENLIPFKYSVHWAIPAFLSDLRIQLLYDDEFDKRLIDLANKNGLMPRYEPSTDGVDHINIYSKGRTKLGRALSNFSNIGFEHPTYGKFASMEGYWYWLSTGKMHDKLKELVGMEAKNTGKTHARHPYFEFEADVKKGLLLRVEQNPGFANAIKDSVLPFSHYYAYGGDLNPKIIADDQFKWIVDYVELIREYLNGRAHKVIIAGSREIDDINFVLRAFNESTLKAVEIVSGKARGTDSLGEEIANKLKLPVAEFPADWDNLGKGAGMVRNKQMGDYATALVACPKGMSIGTRGMISYMKRINKPFFVAEYK